MKNLQKSFFFMILIYLSVFEVLAISPSTEFTHSSYFEKADEVLKMMGIDKLQQKVIEASKSNTPHKREEIKSKILQFNIKNMDDTKANLLADKATEIWNELYFYRASYDQMKLVVIHNALGQVSEEELDSLKLALRDTPIRQLTQSDKMTFVTLYKLSKDACMNASDEAVNAFVLLFIQLLEKESEKSYFALTRYSRV